MTFLRAFLDPFRRYADFRGRSARTTYWTFTLINVLIALTDQVLLGTLQRSLTGPGMPNRAAMAGVSCITVYFIAATIPAWAVQVRRLHDTGRSGWYALLTLLPVAGPVALLVFNVRPGTPGENRWGAPPVTGGERAAPVR